MTFAHLHVHTEHSFLDGAATVKDLVERVVEVGQDAVAITDHGEVSGHLRFQRACLERGIKPIFGIEGYFCDDRSVKEGRKGERYEHMTVLAKNEVGLRNLWALSSEAYLSGFYYDPRFDWELLERYREGLIVTTGCMNGVVASRFVKGGEKYNPDEGFARIARLLDIFGEDLYVELHTFKDERQAQVNMDMASLAADLNVPVIAVSDVHYLRADDWWHHEMLTAAGTHKTFDDPTRYRYGPGQLYLMTEEEVRKRLSYLGPFADEGIRNADRIAASCDVLIETKKAMPVYGPTSDDDAEELWRRADEGFRKRIERLGIDERAQRVYRLRLLDELELVLSKGFAGYFLIVADLVRWAKSKGILVGPSRGSVGGSLLAYCLGITEIDPLTADLLFERFLDQGRESIPDIDIDFPSVPDESGISPRDAARAYLEGKYHTATIGTLSVMAPKRLLRDFCRVLKIPKADEEAMVRLVETVPDLGVSQFDVSWDDVMSYLGDDLKRWQEKYPRLFELLMAFRNHIRHDSAHAAGVVVSKEPLLGNLPLRVKSDEVRTQVDMGDVESLGYVKMDILGLRTLSTLDLVHRMVRQNHRDAPAHYYDWQYEWNRYYEDPAVYEALSEGNNIGVFQLETGGMRQVIKRFKPRNLLELADLLALFRPGITRAIDDATGMSLLELYLRKREGKVPVVYAHPALEPILRRTYGQFLYQEQVMRACAVLAGYSSSEQDRIRKILGKMHRDEMKAERTEFVARAVVHSGMSEDEAHAVFDEMETFGIYGFNASHAYAYAMLAYWCAWMKHYYPREFMTALFATNEADAPLYIREARRLGIPVLPPDINTSQGVFSLTDAGIRYGLHSVKYVAGAATEIVERRPFTSIDDMYERLPKKRVNRRVWYSLIRVGALDSLMNGSPSPRRDALRRYLTLRGEFEDEESFRALCRQLKIDDIDACERELLGMSVSHDPFVDYLGLMTQEDNFSDARDMFPGERRVLCGIVHRVRKLKTKRGSNPGREMAQFWIERPYSFDTVQVVAFPETYGRFANELKLSVPVWCKVERLEKDEGVQLVQLVRLDRLDERR